MMFMFMSMLVRAKRIMIMIGMVIRIVTLCSLLVYGLVVLVQRTLLLKIFILMFIQLLELKVVVM